MPSIYNQVSLAFPPSNKDLRALFYNFYPKNAAVTRFISSCRREKFLKIAPYRLNGRTQKMFIAAPAPRIRLLPF